MRETNIMLHLAILSSCKQAIVVLILIYILIMSNGWYQFFAYAIDLKSQEHNSGEPIISDPKLKVEVVFRGGGLKFPTSMAFLGPNDILVLEKNNGTVRRIVNGMILPEPLLDVNVATKYERGMLGIAVAPKHENKPTYVFLYYTQIPTKDGEDITKGTEPLGNRLYRYELVDNKLINPNLLLDLPATPGPIHNGGKIKIGPDNNVYLVIGDVNGHMSKVENVDNGTVADLTGGILRITQGAKAVHPHVLGDEPFLNLYYAYGIRNSFGIDFDPVTKKLWDTENGLAFGDEINLVQPGFNSGHNKVQGIWKTTNNLLPGNITLHPSDLVDFNKKGKYSPPELTFNHTIAPTAIKFLNSNKLGKQYQNDMFVGDFNNGNLYHFELNKKRNQLSLKGPLADRVVNSTNELLGGRLIFGKGFGGITDIEVGPDGYLYVSSIYQSGPNCDPKFPARRHCIPFGSPLAGTIFRIIPENSTGPPFREVASTY